MCSWDGAPLQAEDDRNKRQHLADQAARRAQRMTQRPGLCCVCGTTRSTTAHGNKPTIADGVERCIVSRQCETCQTRTPHAYLLSDELTDCDEQQSYPELDAVIEEELFELEVGEARASGIKVSDGVASGPILASVTQHLDDGEWAVFLDPAASSKRRRLGLQIALDAIRGARARKWFVAAPDPEHARPAVRFAVFADSVGSALVDLDGLEPPTSAL